MTISHRFIENKWHSMHLAKQERPHRASLHAFRSAGIRGGTIGRARCAGYRPSRPTCGLRQTDNLMHRSIHSIAFDRRHVGLLDRSARLQQSFRT